MAIFSVKSRFDLGLTFVLAPERYDPRRDTLNVKHGSVKPVALGSIASTVRQTISPQNRSADEMQFIVFDTSDVREGIVIGRKSSVSSAELGSAKKKLQRNDVLISRLRPYLRQVAFVDNDIPGVDAETELACSTEFFVLRSNNADPIAFLVPFLLSSPVQKVLAASQEGGHHPRFDEEVLLNLPIPEDLIATRENSSNEIIRGIALYRQTERTLAQLIATAESAIDPKQPFSHSW